MPVIPRFSANLARPVAAAGALVAASFGVLTYAPHYLPRVPASLDTGVVLLVVPATSVLLAMLMLAVRLVSSGVVPEEFHRVPAIPGGETAAD